MCPFARTKRALAGRTENSLESLVEHGNQIPRQTKICQTLAYLVSTLGTNDLGAHRDAVQASCLEPPQSIVIRGQVSHLVDFPQVICSPTKMKSPT